MNLFLGLFGDGCCCCFGEICWRNLGIVNNRRQQVNNPPWCMCEQIICGMQSLPLRRHTARCTHHPQPAAASTHRRIAVQHTGQFTVLTVNSRGGVHTSQATCSSLLLCVSVGVQLLCSSTSSAEEHREQAGASPFNPQVIVDCALVSEGSTRVACRHTAC